VMGVAQPDLFSAFRTMHGSTIKYNCDKTLVGAVWINGNAARVVERYLNFKEGLAYGIDQLLEPPGLGALCDSLNNRTTFGRCGRCLFPPACPFNYPDTGKRERCTTMRISRLRSQPWFTLDDPFSRMGCKRVCQVSSWVPKCCKNHYSRDCQ
ncbi:stabilin-1-like, partial [Notothenia coriiceps]|uniref:Stabilin-1-like n=1 Tax=Notothenia coriiceps TaxID=8208 RepID=A0A6I9PJB9_9TELE